MTKSCSVVIIALLLCCGRATAQVKVQGEVFDFNGNRLNADVYAVLSTRGDVHLGRGQFRGTLPVVRDKSFKLYCLFDGATTGVENLSTRRNLIIINIYHNPSLAVKDKDTLSLLGEVRRYRSLSARLHTIKSGEARVTLKKLFKDKLPEKRMAALQEELQRRSDRDDPLLKGGGWRADFEAFEKHLNSKPFKEMMNRP